MIADPKNTGCTRARRGLGSERLAQPVVRDARLIIDVRRQQRVVVLRQQLDQAGT